MKGPTKSQVDFYVDLCSHLVACDPLSITSSNAIRRDISTLQWRVTTEGLSFLTKTLPKLGKALDQGMITSLLIIPSEFKRSYMNENIPAFMQAYFNRVFDDSGCLLDNADPYAVQHLRQVLFFAYKLEVPYQSEEEAAVIATFIQTESEIELTSDVETLQILEVASYITEDVFAGFNPKHITPRHGPGSVATGERLDAKWRFARLYDNIHQLYPYYDYYMVGWELELADRLDWYLGLERRKSGTAKVVLVPKDSRGPRLISCEPLEYQWIQQGLGRKLSSHLESFWMTRGQINFTDQSVNQSLALSSSLSGEYATLDLKDASDRVSLALVRKVFGKTPLLLRCLEACRTSSTLLPDGTVLPLKKFAPMGSALCFPVEAYIFWSVMVAAVSRHFKMRQSEVGRRVFVYGDDIIVPVEWVSLCIQTLESCSLRVNKTKSCTRGSFRESCGIDAFKGVVVTPLRLKKLWSGRKTDGSAYASYTALANMLGSRYKSASNFLWTKLESVYGVIPYGTKFASYPCKIVNDVDLCESFNSRHFKHRYSRRYQREEFFLQGLSSLKVESELDSWLRLLRNIVSDQVEDPSSIVVPRSMLIKRGWRAIY